VFVRSGSTWSLQGRLTASDGAPSDIFGSSVAIAKSTAVVGAPGNQGTGAAYVFVNV
jgi:FG-GAP repeat